VDLTKPAQAKAAALKTLKKGKETTNAAPPKKTG
jgi:hypothetical protein